MKQIISVTGLLCLISKVLPYIGLMLPFTQPYIQNITPLLDFINSVEGKIAVNLIYELFSWLKEHIKKNDKSDKYYL